MPPALMFRVTGTVLHYEPSRGRVWAEAFTKLVWASSDIDATSGIEKETNDSENDDCYGLAAVRVGEVPA